MKVEWGGGAEHTPPAMVGTLILRLEFNCLGSIGAVAAPGIVDEEAVERDRGAGRRRRGTGWFAR